MYRPYKHRLYPFRNQERGQLSQLERIYPCVDRANTAPQGAASPVCEAGTACGPVCCNIRPPRSPPIHTAEEVTADG
jgi:hypothetical protein